MSFGMRNRRASRGAPAAPSTANLGVMMNPDIAFLPPIETIDLDKAKDFEKEQIKTYLEFYGALSLTLRTERDFSYFAQREISPSGTWPGMNQTHIKILL